MASASAATTRCRTITRVPARPAPRARAIDEMPAASSRSMSTIAFATARAAPAFAAAGMMTRNDGGQVARRPIPAEDQQQRDPEGQGQPREAGALRPQVVPGPDREPDGGQEDQDRPAGRRQHEAAGRRGDGDRLRRPQPDAARPGWACRDLRPGVPRGVHDVVEGADRELEQRHRQAEDRGGAGPSPGDERDQAHDQPVEDRRERVDQPDGAGGTAEQGGGRCDRRSIGVEGRRQAGAGARGAVVVRRRRARRSSPPGTRSAGPGRPAPGRGSRARGPTAPPRAP